METTTIHLKKREKIMGSFKVKAMIHSIKNLDECTILKKTGDNKFIANYKGTICTAIYNPFSGYYYVDNIYGIITNKEDIK